MENTAKNSTATSRIKTSRLILADVIIPLIIYAVVGIILGIISVIVGLIPVIGIIIDAIALFIVSIILLIDFIKRLITFIHHLKNNVTVKEQGLEGTDSNGKQFKLAYSDITKVEKFETAIDIHTNVPTNKEGTEYKVYSIVVIDNAQEIYDAYCAQAGVTPTEPEATTEAPAETDAE